ncbi:MAG: D-alanine aminotransferase [Phenylobacterium sp.]|jgi:D-alanine transaminase|uniref:D-amino-acid transaminase n=1 Tax=Phenylobacterium sp. TaxID=1871053 RepID=UPI002617F93F|nr:D-amino-acid transaminase [Phenylobacterium sp.]MDB5434514.1 D-alanine aminotransferase [Phenylobacterium sp.]MDB5464471.1 D-alanine aminotransferase [Phenylobacterium sp.]MDB5496053.1 D-alanine aminotransferase [Phenylobacterium sp.]
MGRIAYVNGRFVPQGEAAVHIEDRGYQFADAVYEVWALFDGRLSDAEGHFARLERSLSELAIPMPMTRAALTLVLKETVRRNRIREGLLYLQVSRGVAPRDHAFPNPPVRPAVIMTVSATDRVASEARAAKGVSVVTTPETRWGRCDIKTVNLLPNALAKQKARAAGAAEAWFVDELGFITEGASSNAWIVDGDGRLRTRDTNANILRGITRGSLLEVIRREGLEVDERPFTPADAVAAKEAFITGAGTLVLPVIAVDGKPVGEGKPGPVAARLRRLYIEQAKASAI